MFPFQLGLNSIPILTHFAPLSVFADVVDISAMGVVMVEDVLYLQRQPPLQTFTSVSVVFYGLGVAVYAFEGISMVLPLESEATNKSKFGRTLGLSMLLISVMYGLFGALGYLVRQPPPCSRTACCCSKVVWLLVGICLISLLLCRLLTHFTTADIEMLPLDHLS